MVSKLIYVGNLGSGYDLSTVIRAMEKDTSLTLDIAGKGPREEELRQQAKALGTRVRFHGYLEAAALEKMLVATEVGIIPMRDDSYVALPYKLGDYLKAGLKVVSSLHGECGAIIEKYKLGETYENGNEESLLAALKRMTSERTTLPDELRAERIYPEYVKVVEQLGGRR